MYKGTVELRCKIYIFLTTTTTTRKKTKPYHPIIARNEDFQFKKNNDLKKATGNNKYFSNK